MSSSIWEIIDCATRHQLTCVVFTNGSLLTRDMACELYRKASVHDREGQQLSAHLSKTHSWASKAHTKSVYAGLDALLSAGFRAPRLALQSAIMKPNMDDVVDLFLFCRTRDIVPYLETYVRLGRGAEESVRHALEPEPDQVNELFSKLQELDEELFDNQWPASDRARVVAYGACNKSQVALTVKLNGDVFRCITESRKLGNIRECSFEQISRSRNTARELAVTECMGCCVRCRERHSGRLEHDSRVIRSRC